MEKIIGQRICSEGERACHDASKFSFWQQKIAMKTKFANKVIMFKNPWNTKMSSIFIMGGKKIQKYKVGYQMHKLG
jgi:hypothetical protein